MGKVIDVNQRTLEQERRNLKQTSKIVRVEANCFAIALFLALILRAVKYAETGASKFCAGLNFLALPFDALVIIVVTNHVMALFAEIEHSDTPFRYSIADKLKGLANAVIAAGGVIGVSQTVVQMVDSFASGSFTATGSIILLSGLFLGSFLYALAYVFALGCKLQQESDETL